MRNGVKPLQRSWQSAVASPRSHVDHVPGIAPLKVMVDDDESALGEKEDHEKRKEQKIFVKKKCSSCVGRCLDPDISHRSNNDRLSPHQAAVFEPEILTRLPCAIEPSVDVPLAVLDQGCDLEGDSCLRGWSGRSSAMVT